MLHMKVPVSKTRDLFLYFVIYSFAGWCLESTYVSFLYGHFVNRGFMYGPFCPVYGFCALLLLLCLNRVRKNPCMLFLGAALFATSLEYLTGFLLQELFGAVLWDYSREPFNIQGRICLKFTVVWGICAVAILDFLHPRIEKRLQELRLSTRTLLACLLILYFLLDCSAAVSTFMNSGRDISHPASTLGGRMRDER